MIFLINLICSLCNLVDVYLWCYSLFSFNSYISISLFGEFHAVRNTERVLTGLSTLITEIHSIVLDLKTKQ